MITQTELIELLNYDRNTGVFTWRVDRPPMIMTGDVAGSSSTKGYRQISVNNRRYQAHRLAWLYVYGKWPTGQIDHINRNKADNRIENLRDVCQSGNLKNRGVQGNNRSGYPGVSWNSASAKWVVHIGTPNGWKYLGIFNELERAVQVRQRAERRFGYLRV